MLAVPVPWRGSTGPRRALWLFVVAESAAPHRGCHKTRSVTSGQVTLLFQASVLAHRHRSSVNVSVSSSPHCLHKPEVKPGTCAASLNRRGKCRSFCRSSAASLAPENFVPTGRFSPHSDWRRMRQCLIPAGGFSSGTKKQKAREIRGLSAFWRRRERRFRQFGGGCSLRRTALSVQFPINRKICRESAHSNP